MMRILGCLAVIAALVGFCATPASAQCGTSQVFGHQLGGTIIGCDDRGQVAGFAYAIGATAGPLAQISTTNAVPAPLTADFICEADGEVSQGSGTCVGVGTHGDGIISIDGNWANEMNIPRPGIPGCPNSAGATGAGRNIIIVRDNSGGGVILSVGYSDVFGGYVAEFADNAAVATSCNNASGTAALSKVVTIGSFTKGGDATNTTVTYSAQAGLPTGAILSDCDPASVGGGSTCQDATGTPENHTFAPGNLYWKAGDCRGAGLDMARARCVPSQTGPGQICTPGGPACPAGTTCQLQWTQNSGQATFPSSMCLFVGATIISDGVESPDIVGASSVLGNTPPPLAPSARALDVRAKHNGGDVVVTWRTDSELGLQGFSIETKGGRQIGGMIAGTGKGGGGSSYSVALKRSDFRNEKSFYVVSLTTEGKLKSDLASF